MVVDFQKLYKSVPSLEGVDCVGQCDGRCCPRPDGPGLSHFILFLPGEAAYLAAEGYEWPVEWHGEVHVARSCPYFKDGICRAYEGRPFDCRTYPVVFDPDLGGSYMVKRTSACPLYENVWAAEVDQVGKLWSLIDPSNEWVVQVHELLQEIDLP